MKSFKVVISRTYDEEQTLGNGILFNGNENVFEFRSIELPIFIVPLKPNSACTNCIPEGTYKITKVYSPTKGHCFQVHNVEGRTNVLIHKGNYASGKKIDTQGCILVGDRFEDINKDGNLDVAGSTDTMKELLRILPNEFNLTII